MGHSKWSNPKAHGEHTGYGNTSRREITDMLRSCQSFDAHSMRARWIGGNSLPELLPFADTEGDTIGGRDFYVIYSYDQAIAAFDPVDGTLHISTYYYSHKTREHQNNAHAWTALDYRNHDWTVGHQYEIVWEQLPNNPYVGELIA